MSETKRFDAPEVDMPMLLAALRSWAEGQNLETQRLDLDTGATAVQCRQRKGDVRKWVGLDVALNVELFYEETGGLHVTVGEGSWINLKRSGMAAIAVVGVAMLWPVLIPIGLGFWKQRKMPEQVFRVVQAALEAQGISPAKAWGSDESDEPEAAWADSASPWGAPRDGDRSVRTSSPRWGSRQPEGDGRVSSGSERPHREGDFVEL